MSLFRENQFDPRMIRTCLFYIYALLHVFPRSARADCWWKVSNQIVLMESVAGAPTFVCGGNTGSKFQRCCVVGDTCLQGSICQFTHQSVFGSGYYIGGCTDENYIDSVCSPRCNDKIAPDIICNQTTDLWACCAPENLGNKKCNNPSNETFEEPSPERLSVVATTFTSSSSSLGFSTSLSLTLNPLTIFTTTTAIQSPSSTDCAAETSSCSSGLGDGAKAGIGVGASIAGIAVLAGLLFLFFRRSKRFKTTSTKAPNGTTELPSRRAPEMQKPGEMYGDTGAEMIESSSPVFGTGRRRPELP